MLKTLLMTSLAALLIADVSWAREPKPDYGRAGGYLGVGGGAAFDFLEDAVGNVTQGAVELSPGGSFNARGGYRIFSWFALEFMYEGVWGLNTEILGVEVGSFNTHSLVGNFKFLVPVWRMHPYVMLGPGVQYGNFKDSLGLGLDTSRWDFVLRTALGVDTYITENWLVNLEVAPSIRFADYSNIASEPTDNVTLTVGMGVQYRF